MFRILFLSRKHLHVQHLISQYIINVVMSPFSEPPCQALVTSDKKENVCGKERWIFGFAVLTIF